MPRRNNRRARSSRPAGHTSDTQPTTPQTTRRRNQKRRKERRRERRREAARNRARELTVDSDGDIEAISETDEEPEQQIRRCSINHDKTELDRQGAFDLQRLRSVVTSIIQECVEEFGVGEKMEDYMDWQPEPPTPVYLVLLSEMPCYPDGRVRRP